MSTEKAQRKGSAVKKRFYATKTRFCVSLQVVLGAAAADGQLFELLAPPAKTHDLPMSPSKIIAEGQIGSPTLIVLGGMSEIGREISSVSDGPHVFLQGSSFGRNHPLKLC